MEPMFFKAKTTEKCWRAAITQLLSCKRQLLGVLMRRTKAVRLWLDSKVEALLCLPTSLRMVAY